MGVKVLYVPNSPWTQGPINGGSGSLCNWFSNIYYSSLHSALPLASNFFLLAAQSVLVADEKSNPYIDIYIYMFDVCVTANQLSNSVWNPAR